MMQFCEANRSWREIPEWAAFLVKFGFNWPKKEPSTRRIALISMPCDSAGAGIVALGAMRKLLEDPDANDRSLHFQRIRNSTGRFLRRRNERVRYKFDCESTDGLWVALVPPRHNTRRTINESTACDWHFEDEPFLEDIQGNQLPYSTIYRDIVDQGGVIHDTNLRQTYSGVCLAGRIMGENKTRDIMSGIQFSSGDMSAGLDQLLSVHDWSREKISRVSFFNSRTKKRDRETAPPCLVIADGDGAFLTVLDHFSQSDIIATIDRTLERDRLETIGQGMTSKSQWYVREEILPEGLPFAPKGISVAIWKKR